MEKKPSDYEEMKDIAPSQPFQFAKRPPLSSKPSGTVTKLSTNYFNMKLKASNYVYVYSVTFEESIPENNTPLRKKIVRGMREQMEKIFVKYVFTGTLLYSPHDAGKEPVRLENAVSGQKYIVTFIQAHVISLQDILYPHKDPAKAQTANTFFNILVKSLLSSLNMVPVGRTGKYLLPQEATPINDYNLQIWPGYKTSVRLCESGLLLEIDYTSRILSQKTAYVALRELQKNSSNFQLDAKEFFNGRSVVAWYGNKRNYVITDVDFTLKPTTHTFHTPEGTMNVVDYMKKKYGITIKDKEQPLLVNIKKPREGPEEKIFLVPELCGLTGLPDETRADFRAMKQIAVHTKLTPDQRTEKMQRLLKLFNRMDIKRAKEKGDALDKQAQPQPAEILNAWGFEINPQPLEVTGRILPPVTIGLGGGSSLSIPTTGQFFFKQPVLSPLALDKWFLVFDGRSKGITEPFVDTLYNASKTFGINVEYPKYLEVRSSRAEEYIGVIQDTFRKYPNPQIVVCILPRNAVNEYHKIKRWAVTQSPPLLTQMIKLDTLERAKNMMPICSKLILQINSKRNGDLWRVAVPAAVPKKSMMVGVDVSREKGSTYLGFASSYDPFFNKYFTQVMKLEEKAEISSTLGNLLVKALARFHEETKRKFLPELVVIYRDGVGETQRREVLEKEVKSILGALEKKYPDYHPRLIFAMVNKKVHTRFFTKAAGGFSGSRGGRRGYAEEEKRDLSNPQPGTVIHSGIIDSSTYEFLMMPQYVNEGTGTPVRVHVLYDTSGLPFETFEELTNALCYGYDNWQGAIRTPSPCKYAFTHAKLTAKYTRVAPDERLLSHKYFLQRGSSIIVKQLHLRSLLFQQFAYYSITLMRTEFINTKTNNVRQQTGKEQKRSKTFENT
eukprot:TRINITY_DN1553_c1_g1_i1.p1 TRINITY_DN1553_c1_g1~~TRINITY_DN1553_c1_g1_i1.p1  ORF type:complete len:895 (-),score=91.64 TRINITY_DN1553_c1_g1_i1:4931-7615(-)